MKIKTRNAQKTYAKILTEASVLFAAKGYAAASMRDIAAKAEIKAATIYHYFKDKTVILRTLFEKYYADLTVLYEQINETLRPDDDFFTGVSAVLRQHRHFVRKNSLVVYLFFIEALRPDSPIKKDLPRLAAEPNRILVKIANHWPELDQKKVMFILSAVWGVNAFLQTSEGYLKSNHKLTFNSIVQTDLLEAFFNKKKEFFKNS